MFFRRARVLNPGFQERVNTLQGAGFTVAPQPGGSVRVSRGVCAVDLKESGGALQVEDRAGVAMAGEVRKRAKGAMMVLTARELEMVRYIAEGLSVPEISRQIHLSPATVRTHIQKLYEKLGVSDRGAAVAEAMRRRLLE